MSKSRLEKFLYALYSLDSSDLPTPLSRIEELYKCLVTGEEAPTFKPLSRVEKYLMAILGGYDVELLPNPLSRVEVLLYKLATGDDNLDDIDSFLSEHEELLAEIIRNGGVGGNIDIEYVLYTLSTESNTLYNTTEKPIKSAILKGQTLVNIKGNEIADFKSVLPGRCINDFILNPVKNNTQYLIMYDLTITNTVKIGILRQKNNTREVEWTDSTEYITSTNGKIILNSGTGGKFIRIISPEDNTHEIKHLTIIEYQDGMENWDIPYFDGMQSVKMPVLTTKGKNLFSQDYQQGKWNQWSKRLEESSIYITSKDYIDVSTIEDTVTTTISGGYKCVLCFYGKNKEHIYIDDSWGNGFIGKRTFNFKTVAGNKGEVYYIRINIKKVDETDIKPNEIHNIGFQIEKGTTATTYEPYKSNILTVNEDVELRGVGDVKDELNLLTGEVTYTLYEKRLTSDIEWKIHPEWQTDELMTFGVNNVKWGTGLVCNRFIRGDSGSVMGTTSAKRSFYAHSNGCYICLYKNELSEVSVQGFKEWLDNNETNIVYKLPQQSIKTVDLSVVDQDGNNTELSTFNDITHVTLSSEGLIPETELEVATKNKEVLNTMSLKMDDISTTQNTLEEASNTQSENVDSTMIATTEIYEGLL